VRVIKIVKINEVEPEIKNKRLRVAAYIRVSSYKEIQESSYNFQLEWYNELIGKNDDWELVGLFADHGKSGLRINDRAEFNNMIDKALKGEIDLILTKSISRFSRNTVDILEIIKKLRERKIAVYFENEKINTLDERSQLIIDIMSAFAQEEARNLSENIKWGYKRRFEKGEIFTKYKNFMGYTCKNNEISIVPEQAIVVEKIFDLYIDGKTLSQIKEILELSGIKTVTGKEKWHVDTIDKMLSNEKYMGDTMLQKTCSIDFMSKKRMKNDGIFEKYYISNSHAAIISKDKFEKVQEEKKKRARLIKNEDGSVIVSKNKYNGKYILGNLLICENCGASYRRRTERGKVMWRCATRIEKGKESCEISPTLEEDIIKKYIIEVVNKSNKYEMQVEEFDEKVIREVVEKVRVYSKEEVKIEFCK
jgi:site-specific DNA recombinase